MPGILRKNHNLITFMMLLSVSNIQNPFRLFWLVIGGNPKQMGLSFSLYRLYLYCLNLFLVAVKNPLRCVCPVKLTEQFNVSMKLKMLTEFISVCIKLFFKSGNIGINIMGKENIVPICFHNMILRQ